MKTIVAILILISAAASIYYAAHGATRPEAASIYNEANISRSGIQLLSLLLGVGGVLILLPQTFTVGAVILIAHSMITIGCFVAARDWWGGVLELVFLQVPIFMVWVGYPSSLLEKLMHAISRA